MRKRSKRMTTDAEMAIAVITLMIGLAVAPLILLTINGLITIINLM